MKPLRYLALLTVILMSTLTAHAGVTFSLFNVAGSCSGAFFWGSHDNATTTTLLARVSAHGVAMVESQQRVEAGKVAFFTFSFPQLPAQTEITVSLSDGTAPAVTHVYTCDLNPVLSDPNSDIDNDGLKNTLDNCVFFANPKQEDGWGSWLGDACEQPYDSRNGAKVFPQKDGNYFVFGNCDVQNRCVVVAEIDPALLTKLDAGEFRRFSTEEGAGWFADVYFIGLTDNGRRFYQVNIYSNGGNLVDDKFTFRI